MKETVKLLLIYVAIGVVAAGTAAYFLYQNKKIFWEEQARNAFVEVIKKEVYKRSGIKVYFAGRLSIPKEKKGPVTVSLESEHGKRDYIIPKYKHLNNIESNSEHRMIQTVVFEEYPLNVDSINLCWSNILKEAGFRGKSITRLSVTDLFNNETDTYSKDSAYVGKSDSLCTYYIGFRCELALTGYSYCSWWQVFSVKDVLLLCGIVVACVLLFILFEKVPFFFQRYFVKKVDVIVEKEIPVIAVEIEQVSIYQLEDDLLFDKASNHLKYRGGVIPLQPQGAILLHAFLATKGHRLSIEEIQQLLWPNGSGESSKMHTAVKRLRGSLIKCGWTLENENFGYQLKKKLHFIEKISQ